MSLILTAHQPAYLCWLGLLAKIASADTFVLVDVCRAEDSGWENRNYILSPTGRQLLTVPLHRGRDVLLSDVAIAQDHAWQRKHWRAIEFAYQKAPYWDLYAPGLEPFYRTQKWAKLVDLTHAMLRWFMDALGLKQPITRASMLGCTGTKSDLVLSMCQKMGATTYIFGALGRAYADIPSFERAGIEVRFQDYVHPVYPQLRRGFVSHMSVLDLMMNVGPNSLEVLCR